MHLNVFVSTVMLIAVYIYYYYTDSVCRLKDFICFGVLQFGTHKRRGCTGAEKRKAGAESPRLAWWEDRGRRFVYVQARKTGIGL